MNLRPPLGFHFLQLQAYACHILLLSAQAGLLGNSYFSFPAAINMHEMLWVKSTNVQINYSQIGSLHFPLWYFHLWFMCTVSTIYTTCVVSELAEGHTLATSTPVCVVVMGVPTKWRKTTFDVAWSEWVSSLWLVWFVYWAVLVQYSRQLVVEGCQLI